MMTISLTIYMFSLATMFIITRMAGAWEHDYDRKNAVVTTFTPLLNTTIVCAILFYLMPKDIIETRKKKQKKKFKNDIRWNLMNTHISKQ